ncbi:MAG: AmmeMemoRadiSam system protein B [Candidatus Micrarchaeia archaeon]|jgi:hypothetical protein
MRLPAVAGSFYPAQKQLLERTLSSFERECGGKELEKIAGQKLFGVVAPHAGYEYSGLTAMHAYKAISQSPFAESTGQKTFAIISPNHTGMGEACSLSIDDWQTPLGEVKSDTKFCHELLSASGCLKPSEEAHANEHSIEVQLPFVQKFFPGAEIAGITILQGENALEVAEDLAGALVASEKKLEQRVMVVASSDFTHYEPANVARQKDQEAVHAICKLDAKKFRDLVFEKRLSICGFGAILSAMLYSKKKGAKEGVVLHFSNSGKANPKGDVVDYASIAFV